MMLRGRVRSRDAGPGTADVQLDLRGAGDDADILGGQLRGEGAQGGKEGDAE